MRNSDDMKLSTEENDSNWKAICFQRLELQLSKMRLGSSADDMQLDDIRDYELYDAVRDKNKDVNHFVDVLAKLCAKKELDPVLILRQVTPMGDSLLHLAAEFGREKIAEWLVDYDPCLHAINNRRDTPLHVAAKAKNIEVMKVILSKFKDESKDDFIMAKNFTGNTALHEAILSKHHEGFDFLLGEHSEGALPLYWDTHPAKSPIYLAIQIGDLEILRRLLSIPFPSNSWPIWKCFENSPLYAAISKRDTSLLNEIVSARKELIYLTDQSGNSPLHYAARTGYFVGVLILLRESPLLAFQRNLNNELPIHLACKRGHIWVVLELLQVGWSEARFWLDNEGRNILHIAAMNGRYNLVKFLLKLKWSMIGPQTMNEKDRNYDQSMISGETMNEKDRNGNTPLHLASRKLCLRTLLLLSRDENIDVKIVNDEGLTARDIVLTHCKFPMKRHEVLADAILKNAGVPLKGIFGAEHVISTNKEWDVMKAADTLLLVATLIATVTFAAGFTVPGGVFSSDDPLPKRRGMAVLADQPLFKIFLIFNTIALYCSILGSIILLWVHLGDRHYAEVAYKHAKIFVNLALITMPVAFIAAIRLVVSNNSGFAEVITIIGSIFIFIILFTRIFRSFPLGSRFPFFRQVGALFIWVNIILFYPNDDIRIDDEAEIHQDGKANQLERLQSIGLPLCCPGHN